MLRRTETQAAAEKVRELQNTRPAPVVGEAPPATCVFDPLLRIQSADEMSDGHTEVDMPSGQGMPEAPLPRS